MSGSFDDQISIEKAIDFATFYLIKHDSRDLLGKTIAIK